MAYRVFISYRRQGASELAVLLYNRLSADGYKPFLDLESMRSGMFNKQIYAHIDECSDVIVLLPENALVRTSAEEDWLYLEVSYAISHKKNVIPVIMRNFVWPAELSKEIEKLRYCHGVEANMEYFDAMYARLRHLLLYNPNTRKKRIGCLLFLTAGISAGLLYHFINKDNTLLFLPVISSSPTQPVVSGVQSTLYPSVTPNVLIAPTTNSRNMPSYAIVDVAAGISHSLGLRADGTVVATGVNDYGECNVEDWTEIVQVVAGSHFSAGLKADGTILYAGQQVNVSSKNNFFIDAKSNHFAAVKDDGTIESSKNFVLEGNHYTQVTVGNEYLVGLRDDGTVVAAGRSYYGECSVEAWKDVTQIATGEYHTLGLLADGSVVATGYNQNDQCDVNHWEDIVYIAAGNDFSVGVRKDGTVELAAYQTSDWIDEVRNWTDIVSVEIGPSHILGRKYNGSVVSSGYNNPLGPCDTQNMKDIQMAVTAGDITVGVKKDGTLDIVGSTEFQSALEWKNIVQLDTDGTRIVGINKYGKAVAAGVSAEDEKLINNWLWKIKQVAVDSLIMGLNNDGTIVCIGESPNKNEIAEGWTDIKQIALGEYAFGLKNDGTVVCAGDNSNWYCDTSSWEKVTSIEAGYFIGVGITEDGELLLTGMGATDDRVQLPDDYHVQQIAVAHNHLVLLMEDGTVLATGNNDYGQCDVSDWEDIVYISAAPDRTIGVKADGTVVSAGRGVNKGGQCDVQQWGIYQLPPRSDETTFQSSDQIYQYGLFDDGSAILLKTNSDIFIGTKLTLPDQIDGHRVIAIGANFINNRNDITDIRIPDGVTYIGREAFIGAGISDIYIPASVEIIEEKAFAYCEQLERVKFANHISKLPAYTFLECEKLSEVLLPAELREIGKEAFGYCSSLQNFQLPQGIERIDTSAFYMCSDLSFGELVIPDSVKYIGDNAFAHCGIYKVTFGKNDIEFGGNPFVYSSDLTIRLPDNHPTIRIVDGIAFDKTDNSLFYCPNNAVYDTYEVPHGTEVIDSYAFFHCNDIDDFILPDSLTTIDKKAFMLTGIRSINIPDSVHTINEGAFALCVSLERVYLSPLMTKIADEMFYLCDSLSFVSFPSNITSIGNYAFSNCGSLTKIYLPEKLEHIGNYAFSCCWALEEIFLPNGLKYIGEAAFVDCPQLTRIRIPESVEYIHPSCFGKTTLEVYENSYAHTYVEEQGIPYEVIKQ